MKYLSLFVCLALIVTSTYCVGSSSGSRPSMSSHSMGSRPSMSSHHSSSPIRTSSPSHHTQTYHAPVYHKPTTSVHHTPIHNPIHRPTTPIHTPIHRPTTPIHTPIHRPTTPIHTPIHKPTTPIHTPIHKPTTPIHTPIHKPNTPIVKPNTPHNPTPIHTPPKPTTQTPITHTPPKPTTQTPTTHTPPKPTTQTQTPTTHTPPKPVTNPVQNNPKPAQPQAGSLSADQVRKIMPGAKADVVAQYTPYLNQAMKDAGINTPARQNAFLAQLAHESGQFRYMQELASGKAYEGRKDLGNTQPGDGERYKGRGPIQITGRSNYAQAGKALGIDLVNHPELAAKPEVGFKVAAWYWNTRHLNDLADKNTPASFSEITRRVNGCANCPQTHAAERNQFWNRANEVNN